MIEVSAHVVVAPWTHTDWLTLGQLVATVLGLGLAAIPLWQTANAVQRTNNLLAKRLLSNDLLVLLPELHQLEDTLQAALRADDADQMVVALVHYIRRVGTIDGHLSANDTTKDEALGTQLRASAKSARTAKIELSGVTSRTVFDITKVTMEKVSKAVQEAANLTARLQKESD